MEVTGRAPITLELRCKPGIFPNFLIPIVSRKASAVFSSQRKTQCLEGSCFIIQRNSMLRVHAPVLGRMNLKQALQFMEHVWINLLQYFQWITGDWGLWGIVKLVTVISKSQPRNFDPSIPSCSLSLSGGAKTKDGSVVTWSSKNLPPIFFLRCGYPKVGAGKMDGSLTWELMVVTLRSSKSIYLKVWDMIC